MSSSSSDSDLENLRRELDETKEELKQWTNLVTKAIEKRDDRKESYERQQELSYQRVAALEAQITRKDSNSVSLFGTKLTFSF